MKKLLLNAGLFSLLFSIGMLVPVVHAQVGGIPEYTGSPPSTSAPNYNCPSGQTYSSTGSNGSGGCVALPTTANPAGTPTNGSNLTYTPLEPIPGATTNANGTALSFPALINSMFTVLFTVGALFAVLMLTISGIRYMLSDVVINKERAIKRITACIYGLLLLAGTWLILNTINPQLLNFTLIPCPQGSTGCTITGAPPTNTTPPPNPYSSISFQQAVQNEQTVQNAITDNTDAQNAQTYDQSNCASIAQQQTALVQTASAPPAGGGQGCVINVSGMFGSVGNTQCLSYRVQYQSFCDQLAECQSDGNGTYNC